MKLELKSILICPSSSVELRAYAFLAKFIMLDSKFKGNLTELLCLAAFTELGYQISIPYGDHARYDFIADINNNLYRIQCKTSSLEDEGVYSFSCRSTAANHSRSASRSYSKDEIDFFATIIDKQCYLIPVEATGGCSKRLRFVPPKNGQKVGVSFASEYLLETQLAKLKEG